MGKGGDDPNCVASSGMGMAGMLGIYDAADSLQSILVGDSEIQIASNNNNAKVAAGKRHSREVEQRERKWAEAVLDKVEDMRSEGRDEKEINAYFNRRARDLTKRRGAHLVNSLEIQGTPSGKSLQLADSTEKLIAATTAIDIMESSGHPDLQFQEEFMNSPDFLDNLNKVISRKTADKGKSVANKDMEDAYRDAALLAVGIYGSKDTVGRWVSPKGTEYHIQVLREFSETALMDLIMMARPVDGSETQVYTMQWKSYKTTAPIGQQPTPGAERNIRSVKIAKLTDLPDRQKHSLDALSREVQVRFLATNTFADTTAHSQPDANGESQLITHTTRLSMPEVHKAISRAKDLPSLFKPVEKGDGKYGFMEAELETQSRDGQPVRIRILSQMSAKLGSNGKPIKRNGRYLVDESDSAGVNKGKISIDITHSGWHKLHKLSCISKSYAEAIAEFPEKLKTLGIE